MLVARELKTNEDPQNSYYVCCAWGVSRSKKKQRRQLHTFLRVERKQLALIQHSNDIPAPISNSDGGVKFAFLSDPA